MRSSENIKWVEVWIDTSSAGGYVLLLRCLHDDSLKLADPQEGGRVIWDFPSYEEAVHWLNEDEYDLVEGRWIVED